MTEAQEAKKDLIRFVKLKTTMQPAFVEVAVAALDRQTPERIVVSEETIMSKPENYRIYKFACPRCGAFAAESTRTETVVNYSARPVFCRYCGQRLDWSGK